VARARGLLVLLSDSKERAMIRLVGAPGTSRLIRCAVACCLAVPLATGCGSHKEVGNPLTPDELTPEAEAILHVGQAYRDAYTALKKPPASIKDLKPHLTKFGDPDKALVSPNPTRSPGESFPTAHLEA
jgi:hypothetical protein